MAIIDITENLTWLYVAAFIVVAIVIIAMCVCLKDHEKPQDYGTAGRLSIARNSPVFQYQPRNGGTVHSKPDYGSDEANLKRNSWTVKDRALPEIPDSTLLPTSNRNSIAPAPVNPTVILNRENPKLRNHTKSLAPQPPVDQKKSPSEIKTTPETLPHLTVITVNDKPHLRDGNSTASAAKTRLSSDIESIPGPSTSRVILKRVEKTEVFTPSCSDGNLYDAVSESGPSHSINIDSASSSPVCIRIGDPQNSGINILRNPPASLAVSGGVPSSDIPYMTPPLLHVASSINESNRESTSEPRSEVPYTVISVREPLARVREITMKKQRAALHQNSEDSDDHYAMVPEEEQMYAEIGSGHDSGSSSITYAHIEPRELPPVPPTVESLKSVAHAHSRQASTVSTSSFASGMSSSGEPSSPILRNPSSLYSSVEKNTRQRKTIHVAEGASLVSTVEKRKKVEDLYAKVRKKKVALTIKASTSDDYHDGQDCITPPPSPWASTTPPAPPPITGRLHVTSLNVLPPGCAQHIRRHSADPNFPDSINDNRLFDKSNNAVYALPNSKEDSKEPGYEQIYSDQDNSEDSCYEKIKSDKEDKSEPGYEKVRPVGVANKNDPGYESVHDSTDEDSLDPGYECVAKADSDVDPGYEPVGASADLEDNGSDNYSVVKLDDNEPEYEMVKKVVRTESDAADPGYEKIRKVSRSNGDPGYERVRNCDDDVEPGYETVSRSDSDADPVYEIVQHQTKNGSRYASASNSTVLYISGKSDASKSSHDKSGGVSSHHATFL